MLRKFSTFSTNFALSQSSQIFYSKLKEIGGNGAITVDVSNPFVARVLIDNPTSRNALTAKMMSELADTVKLLSSLHSHVAVTLQGAGGYFCAGADLALVGAELQAKEEGAAMCQYFHDVLTAFNHLPLLSVALIEGGAVGGGSELATACDFRIFDSKARIHFKQVHLGLTPGWGGGTRLVELVGRREALKILCAGNSLSAEVRGLRKVLS
jgi:ethylmalonyl-CoA/methylmalonyl-CoA decarboxylase